MGADDLAGALRRAEGELVRGFRGTAAELAAKRRRLRLDLLRQHLTSAHEGLRARHEGGASGRESLESRTGLMDRFLRVLFRLADAEARGADLAPTPCVVVALGGYGRGELHPSSDLDIMLIHGGELTPSLQRIAQEVLYTLWDLGLNVGHSFRSLEDCQALARTDLPSRTSMQAARFIAGDRALFRTFQRTLRQNVFRKDYPAFLEATLAERDQRYRKHGASVYLQEPNVKESAGGLRDVHTALWLAFTKFGARTLLELEERGLLTPREREATDQALTFLWRVRNELHFLAGHKQDVLTRPLQAQIAGRFGYADDEAALGVEKFMREYYLRARTIHRVSARLIARAQEGLSRRGTVGRRLRREALADGLIVYDGRLHLAGPDALRKDPARLVKVFWHAHRLGSELDVELERAVEEAAPLFDEALRASAEVRDLFFAILRHWGRLATTLRTMHDLGFLGAYLPEFGALTCLVQYDLYHRYTVDQHSLLAVENLEAIAPGGSAEAEELAELLAEVERPELLVLGMLLHDIGKSRGHGHVAKGIPMTQAVNRRLGLPAEDARVVQFLVEHHLLFSHTAERRDLHDPKTIERVAELAGDVQRLTMLYLLTVADIKAVAPGLWTAWRGALLRELYVRVRARLAGGRPERPRREVLAAQILHEVGGLVASEVVGTHLAGMSDRYLATTPAQRIVAHLALIERLREEPVATELFHHPDLGYSDFVVVAPDQRGLFSLIAGTLAAHRVNVLSAQIETRGDGIALDTFQVNEPAGEAILEEGRWEEAAADLRAILTGEQSVEALLARRRPRLESAAAAGPVKVSVDNQLSDTHTVIEIKAPDRLGLLYLITKTLAREGLDIATAKIATDIDQAFDAFYVTDRRGRRVEDPGRIARLREALEAVLLAAEPLHAGSV